MVRSCKLSPRALRSVAGGMHLLGWCWKDSNLSVRVRIRLSNSAGSIADTAPAILNNIKLMITDFIIPPFLILPVLHTMRRPPIESRPRAERFWWFSCIIFRLEVKNSLTHGSKQLTRPTLHPPRVNPSRKYARTRARARTTLFPAAHPPTAQASTAGAKSGVPRRFGEAHCNAGKAFCKFFSARSAGCQPAVSPTGSRQGVGG